MTLARRLTSSIFGFGLVLCTLPAITLAGGPITVTTSTISDSPQGNGGYGTVTQNWYNNDSFPVTLVFSDASTLPIAAHSNASKNFTQTTTYSLLSNPSVTSKVTVYSPLVKSSATATSISLSWGADTGTLGVTTLHYSLYRNGQVLTTVNGTSYTDTTPTAGQVYSYYISSNRSDGEHRISNDVSVTTNSDSAPSAPTNLRGTITGTNAELSWTASTDDQEVSNYIVYQNGIQVGLAYTNRYSISNLQVGQSYSYTVKAQDSADQLSSTSNTAILKIEAATSPTPTASPSIKPSPSPTIEASPTPSLEPLLQKIIIDGKEYNPSPTYSPIVTKGQVLHLTGSAPSNASLTIGVYSTKESYPTTADASGNWSVDVPTAALEIGTHRITIAMHKNGSTGTEQDAAQFNLKAAIAATTASTATPKSAATNDKIKQFSLYFILLTGLAVLISGGFLFRNYRREKKYRALLRPGGAASGSKDTDSPYQQ